VYQFLRFIDCLDRKRTKVRNNWEPINDWGDFGVRRPVTLKRVLIGDEMLFRIKGYSVCIVIRSDLFEAMEQAGFQGQRVEPLRTSWLNYTLSKARYFGLVSSPWPSPVAAPTFTATPDRPAERRAAAPALGITLCPRPAAFPCRAPSCPPPRRPRCPHAVRNCLASGPLRRSIPGRPAPRLCYRCATAPLRPRLTDPCLVGEVSVFPCAQEEFPVKPVKGHEPGMALPPPSPPCWAAAMSAAADPLAVVLPRYGATCRRAAGRLR